MLQHYLKILNDDYDVSFTQLETIYFVLLMLGPLLIEIYCGVPLMDCLLN
jgi:hypothetical protein